jgi:hypothetical protein
LHISVILLQAGEAMLLILAPLLFQDLDVLVGFPFVWAK